MKDLKRISRLILFLLVLTPCLHAASTIPKLTFYDNQIYEAFISNNMQLWEKTMKLMEAESASHSSPDLLLHLTITQYGYIGYLIGMAQYTSARNLLVKTTKNTEKLKNTKYKAEAFALMSGLNGYEIGLDKYKAPFIGHKSGDYTEASVKIAPFNPLAWFEKGNIYFHMPGLFGGSYDKAISYYSKAVKYYDNASHLPRWLKLNTMVWLAKSYEADGQLINASMIYQMALLEEPDFKWVKNDLYPELLTKI